MTIGRFRCLSEIEKIETLILHATKIGESKDEEHLLFLYHMGQFYVVVVFCAKTDELLKLEAFETNQKITSNYSPPRRYAVWGCDI